MYPADGGPGQTSQQGPPAQRPWDPNSPQQYRPDPNYPQLAPVSSTYPPRGDLQPSTAQPASLRPDRPEMAAIHHPSQYPYPQQPGPYLPAPSNLYPPHPDQYRQGPPPQGQPQQQVGQSAPRQRTAIACKYCRRRKIRCSGFENSEDGRCGNCIRFSQECVFTPVSAQTQAFVPAQALYGRGRGGPPPGGPQQLYGPYGNRLPPQHDPYGPPPPGHPGYTLPSPGVYPPQHGQPYPYPPPGPPQHYDHAQAAAAGRRRGRDEPHSAKGPPPPNPAQGSHLADHRDPHGQPPPGYGYPDPSQYPPPGTSPSSSNGGVYPGHPHAQPYYGGPVAPRRHSPGSAYSYDPNRESQSPHGAPGAPYPYPPGSAPGQHAAPATSAPPPTSTGSARPSPPSNGSERGRSGMSINDIVGSESGGNTSGGERSAADSNMVSALNRPAKRSS